MQRVDVGDAQRVADQASGRRAAARADGNILSARVTDEVPDDQEVAGIAHLLDHLDFVGEALLVLGQRTPQGSLLGALLEPRYTIREAFSDDALEIAIDGVALGDLELRERIAHRLDSKIAALGDGYGAREGFGKFTEDLGHFLGGLEKELVGGEAHAVRIRHGLAGLDAHQDFLRASVGLRQVVAIVGGDQRDAAFPREPHQFPIEGLVDVQALVLHLEKKIAFAEDVLETMSGRGGISRSAAVEVARQPCP